MRAADVRSGYDRLRNFPAKVGVIIGLLSRFVVVLDVLQRPPPARSARARRTAQGTVHVCTLFLVGARLTVVDRRSVRSTTSSHCLARKRLSRLACQDTVPSAATSSPSLDALAFWADISSLNWVRACTGPISPMLRLTPNVTTSPKGHSGDCSVPRGGRKKTPQAYGRSRSDRPHGNALSA